MTNTNTRNVYPIAELSMIAVGNRGHIGQLLNGEFDEATLTNTFTGESITLEVDSVNRKSLTLYDVGDVYFEHSLIDDRLVEINRANFDQSMERDKDDYRLLFTVGEYSLIDEEDRFDVAKSFLIFDDRAFALSAEFSYRLAAEYCGGTKARLVEIIEEVVSFCENIRK